MANYPVGHQREGFPAMVTWAEAIEMSDRTDFAMRWLRDNFDDFPEPVHVHARGAVYIREEMATFLKNHPKVGRRPGLPPETVERMYTLADANVSPADIATVLEVSVATVYKYLRNR